MEIASIAVREEAVSAYQAVEREREYQNVKWPAREGHLHSVTEWLVFIDDYVREAKHVLSRQPDPIAIVKALHAVRKVGAMAIACMEQNGVRTRDSEGPRPVGFSE